MSASLPVANLESHLGYWLRFVSNHVSHAFSQKLGAEGVTPAEWAFMRALYEHELIGPRRLADRMGLTRSAISKLADRLTVKGFVTREDRDDDARSHMLALTPTGRKLVPRLAALADINDAEFFDDLTREERSDIERILKRIVERRGMKAVPLS